MLKKLIIGFAILIVLFAGSMYYVSQNAGKMVAGIIENQGSRVTQVTVRVKGVDINLTDLKAAIRGVSIANPPGFKTARAIGLDKVSVKLSKNWSSRTVVIDKVLVNAPNITYEIGPNGSNIAAIQENVETFIKGDNATPSPNAAAPTTAPTTTTAKKNGAEAKVLIKDLYIRNGKINVSASLLPNKSLSVALPTIHLRNIGKATGGASPAEVIDLIVRAVSKASEKAAGSLDLSQLGLSGISGRTVKDVLNGALQNRGDIGKTAKDTLNKVKGLFGK